MGGGGRGRRRRRKGDGEGVGECPKLSIGVQPLGETKVSDFGGQISVDQDIAGLSE